MNIDINKAIRYWCEGAAYDLDTGRSLIAAKKFPYALFFGHLALEKLLKALVVRTTQQHAPFTHSLPLLASKLDFKMPDAMVDKLAEFMEFHIEARYPEEHGAFYRKCSESFTREKFQEIEETYRWLMQKLNE